MRELRIPDGVLAEAGTELIEAANLMVRENVARPREALQSITGIGSEVESYLRGLAVGRAALADAASTASDAVLDLMTQAEEVDARLAAGLRSGFAVRGR